MKGAVALPGTATSEELEMYERSEKELRRHDHPSDRGLHEPGDAHLAR